MVNVWSICEWKVYKCDKYELKEDIVLFGNAKDFESDEIFDFIMLFA